jgi:hypothetical protein
MKAPPIKPGSMSLRLVCAVRLARQPRGVIQVSDSYPNYSRLALLDPPPGRTLLILQDNPFEVTKTNSVHQSRKFQKSTLKQPFSKPAERVTKLRRTPS